MLFRSRGVGHLIPQGRHSAIAGAVVHQHQLKGAPQGAQLRQQALQQQLQQLWLPRGAPPLGQAAGGRDGRRQQRCLLGAAVDQEHGASSAQQAAKAAAGSEAAVIGRPTTKWLAPAATAWAGVITRC